jgi:hypothetical protein
MASMSKIPIARTSWPNPSRVSPFLPVWGGAGMTLSFGLAERVVKELLG